MSCYLQHPKQKDRKPNVAITYFSSALKSLQKSPFYYTGNESLHCLALKWKQNSVTFTVEYFDIIEMHAYSWSLFEKCVRVEQFECYFSWLFCPYSYTPMAYLQTRILLFACSTYKLLFRYVASAYLIKYGLKTCHRRFIAEVQAHLFPYKLSIYHSLVMCWLVERFELNATSTSICRLAAISADTHRWT